MMDVACDACCLINLFATKAIFPMPDAHASELELTAQQGIPNTRLHIPNRVGQESLFVLCHDKDDSSKLAKQLIDLKPLFQGDLLAACDLHDKAEYDLFVSLAIEVDDGEAACLAVAKHRNWLLATDDRRASRLAGEINVGVINTAQLIKKWAVDLRIRPASIGVAINNIQKFAKFIPRIGSPEYDWWNLHSRLT